MSQLNVDTIKKADGTGNLSVPAETGTVVTTASPSLGRRNLIINGAMQVAQRGTVSNNDTNKYGGPDRFITWVNGTLGTVEISQSTNAPDGFSNSYRIETTSAGNYSDSAAYEIWGQVFEGQNLQGLAFGTSSAKTVTASFWVRSSQTGNINLEWRNNSASRHNVAQYTINAAGTWEYKTITFTGDTVSGIANNNASGAYLIHWMKSASNYTGGTVPTNGFVTQSSSNMAEGATVDIISGVGRYIEFTGVQLEVGSVASTYEHRSYGEELALCRRYYYMHTNSTDAMIGNFANYDGTNAFGAVQFPVQMRTSPSFDQYHPAGAFRYYRSSGFATFDSAFGQQTVGRNGWVIQMTIGGLTQGDCGWAQYLGADAYLAFDAEL
jgi:hypothetical protein